jgi:Mn2+/Fe2+ NRAMP family transporter
LLSLFGPGILVAATGIGAGDLATAAFTGNKLGLAILWAVLVGAGLKFVLNEGLARWQLTTGDTLLEGAVRHFGRPVQYLFLLYLLLWSFFVGSALMSACGATAHAMLPVFRDSAPAPGPASGADPDAEAPASPPRFTAAEKDKVLYGLLHSALGVLLVRLGGYRLFEKVMGFFIAVMFVTVVVTALLLVPAWSQVAAGLVVPRIPQFTGQGPGWTVALMGGVGGTLTVLCYGYWIREEGRTGVEQLTTCRIDLAVAYAVTAVFGLAMVVIGSTITVEGGGAGLVVALADRLQERLGPVARWAFLFGAWGAVGSSLLGVWQSVPYLFADFCGLMGGRRTGAPRPTIDARSAPYRLYLYALATVPAIGLAYSFQAMQKVYAIVGAAFMPMLALALLFLNGRTAWVGHAQRNRRTTAVVLVLVVVFFAIYGYLEIRKKLLG